MRRTSLASTVFLSVACASVLPAGAEVTASGPSGFSLKIETPVSVAPAEAFDRFVRIGSWWNKDHSYSGDAANMTLDTKPGGCFCERLPNGGFVKHLDVVFSAPGKVLRLAGGLGPLQDMGASGVMAFQFKAEGTGTRVIMTYTVSGFATGDTFTKLAPAVDGVLNEQLVRFTKYAQAEKTQ